MTKDFGDYIIYADESGDHSLSKIDDKYPIFCLALCVIRKEDYITKIVPDIQRLKFDYWGHDKIVLHEREIRKQEKDFQFLNTNEGIKNIFMERISKIIENSDFYIISSVIDKNKLNNQSDKASNPYNIALKLCMESLMNFLMLQNQSGKIIHCIFEGRGKIEDNELENTFNEIIDNKSKIGKNINFKAINFEMKLLNKMHNSTGTQLADLIARPIGLNNLRPNDNNTAYDTIKKKYYSTKAHRVFP